MKYITAREWVHNIIAKSEPYDILNPSNIDLFILDKYGNIVRIEPTHTIKIQDYTYYYTLTENNWIYMYNNLDFDRLFAEHNSESYGWYGDHFSFGYSREFPDILNFHLTNYQYDHIHNTTIRNGIYCDFKITDFIDDVKNPKCTARKSNSYLPVRFNDVFSEDIAYIKDVIEFGLTETISVGVDEYLYNGTVYKIQTGKKGGLFILVQKTDGTYKKKRIPKTAAVVTASAASTSTPEASITVNTKGHETNASQEVTSLGAFAVTPTHSPAVADAPNIQAGGSLYTYKFIKLLGQFIIKFAKTNNIVLETNTYIFVKQSTHHMIVLLNYLTKRASQSKHQYILHANTNSVNTYLSPRKKNKDIFTHTSMVRV